jgi:hypothetical protein
MSLFYRTFLANDAFILSGSLLDTPLQPSLTTLFVRLILKQSGFHRHKEGSS